MKVVSFKATVQKCVLNSSIDDALIPEKSNVITNIITRIEKLLKNNS